MWSLESWFSGWDPKDKKELAGGGGVWCGAGGGGGAALYSRQKEQLGRTLNGEK